MSIGLLTILVVCIPMAFIVTIVLSPFWSWLERTQGIESMGHSGPADWCFGVVYAVVVLGWCAGLGFFFARQEPN